MIKLWIIWCILATITLSTPHLTATLTLACNITIRGCTYCNPLDASQCQMCDYNFTLNPSNWTCECQQKYFLDSDQAHCLVCFDLFGLNCKDCSSSPIDNSTYCSLCGPGYYSNNISCCLDAISNCSNCSLDGTRCFACANGSHLIDGKCSFCQMECLVCGPNTKCTQCKDTQTYLLNGTCVYCSNQLNGCKLCNDAVTCTQCISLEYYLTNGKCQLCSQAIKYCQECSSSSLCIQCLQGYVINQNSTSCILCGDLFKDCIKCSNASTCDECKAGGEFIEGQCRGKESSSQQQPWWLIILIIGAALLVIALIVVCCYIRKCRKKENAASVIESDNNQSEKAQSAKSDNNIRKSLV